MRLITKVIRILLANFRCNRLTTVQDIQDYASLIFWGIQYIFCSQMLDNSFQKVFQ